MINVNDFMAPEAANKYANELVNQCLSRALKGKVMRKKMDRAIRNSSVIYGWVHGIDILAEEKARKMRDKAYWMLQVDYGGERYISESGIYTIRFDRKGTGIRPFYMEHYEKPKKLMWMIKKIMKQTEPWATFRLMFYSTYMGDK